MSQRSDSLRGSTISNRKRPSLDMLAERRQSTDLDKLMSSSLVQAT